MANVGHLNQNSLGAIAAVFSAFCFSVNDATIKFLSGGYALPQLMFLRSILAIVVIAFILAPLEGKNLKLKGEKRFRLAVRGVLMVFANLTFFLGLAVLPLADTVGIFFICPLIITALSVMVLREKVGPQRWMAVAAGLLGVLIMVRPGGDGFQVAMLLPLLAATSYAILQVMTRSVSEAASATVMSLYMQGAFFVIMGLLGLFFGAGHFQGTGGEMFAFLLRPWVWPPLSDLGFLLLIGVATAGSNFFVSQAYRLGEASLVAPLEYAAMPMAVAFGVVIFGDWPSFNSWIGISLIISAGLFVLLRESILNRPHRFRGTKR